jgi:hypothetical protein
MNEQREAKGVYCTLHVGDPVMHCSPCKKFWSPCCGETHECPEHPVVQGSGADLIPASARFRRGTVERVRVRRPAPDPLEGMAWLGWEM